MKPKGCSKESLSFRNDFCIMTTYRSKPVVKPEDTHRFSRLRAYSLIASLCTLFYNTGRFRQNHKSWGSMPNLTNPDICKSSDFIINDTFFLFKMFLKIRLHCCGQELMDKSYRLFNMNHYIMNGKTLQFLRVFRGKIVDFYKSFVNFLSVCKNS